MCGYTSYRDSRLIPSDINDDDECDYRECIHWNACERQFKRHSDLMVDYDELVEMLGCEGCDEWDG